MWRADETFIVRMRRGEPGAVVEQPRLSRRRPVRDVSQVGALILAWLEGSQPSEALTARERLHCAPDGGAIGRGGGT